MAELLWDDAWLEVRYDLDDNIAYADFVRGRIGNPAPAPKPPPQPPPAPPVQPFALIVPPAPVAPPPAAAAAVNPHREYQFFDDGDANAIRGPIRKKRSKKHRTFLRKDGGNIRLADIHGLGQRYIQILSNPAQANITTIQQLRVSYRGNRATFVRKLVNWGMQRHYAKMVTDALSEQPYF